MTDEFKIDDAKLDKISLAFGAEKNTVETLYKAYCQFSPNLKGQFLAHVMRGIECYFRKMMKNNRFIVICEPYKEGEFYDGQKQASAYYYPPKSVVRFYDKQNSSFIINYNKDLSEKDLRDYISHEIGHLFWVATFDAKKDKIRNMPEDINAEMMTEPLSSIFGIFTMSEKNDFYANYDSSARNHKSWQELLDSFIKIHRD
jgi:Zn-dependent peptidase ImmA (M78 family)